MNIGIAGLLRSGVGRNRSERGLYSGIHPGFNGARPGVAREANRATPSLRGGTPDGSTASTQIRRMRAGIVRRRGLELEQPDLEVRLGAVEHERDVLRR